MKRIRISAQPLIGKKTGVGYYVEGIIKALAKLDHVNDYSLIYFQFFTTPGEPPIDFKQPNFHYRRVRFMPGRVFHKLLKLRLLPPLDLIFGKRLYLFPNFVSWPLLFSPSVVIIYDLSYLLHGQYTDEQNRRFLTKFVPRSVKRANLIITISEHAKTEIVEHYQVDPEKIILAYPAIDPETFKPASDASIQAARLKFNLPEHYLLFVGTLEPRKNIVGLLDAYMALPKKTRDRYALVLAGSKGWKDEQIGSRLKELLDTGENIIQTGYFDGADLPGLYSGADIFVYPTHYEGFGMPPLEAMACGTPVIVGDNSSLPEVVGVAGRLVDDTDTAAITRAIQEVIDDPKLATRMRRAGLKQAAVFRWEKSAKIIKDSLEKI